ncbi:MAG TPA: histidine kinase [Nocardioides sp.]|nr:histidine kinase [Nocardioides sp.]
MNDRIRLLALPLVLTALDVPALVLPALGAAALAGWVAACLLLCFPAGRRAVRFGRDPLRWSLGALSLGAAAAVSFWALHQMTGIPASPLRWTEYAGSLVPLVVVIAAFVGGERASSWFLVNASALAASMLVIVAVYLVLVVGINGAPHDHERDIMAASIVAAVVAAGLVPPARHQVRAWITSLLDARTPSTAEVVGTFGTRMSRAVPMDELLLQLVESLRETVPGTRAEVWTGSAARLGRAVSVPSRPAAAIAVTPTEEQTIARTRIGGRAWASVWLPSLLPDEDTGDVRIVPVAHLGELLGLVCVYRPAGADPFDEEDDAALVELAHQLGLALHNVNLDSALQASLDELAERNRELQASRLRIVNASDSSRREIERNLHDGAQQHLVALAVKAGLVRTIAEDGDTETVLAMLDQLRDDVRVTINEVRELAHGIYPPLLRDRGLGDALRAAANRSPIACTVDADLPARFAQDTETAAYFCTLEAMQNAGKHAGADATVAVTARTTDGRLEVEVRDDGAGFDTTDVALSHGFVNMRDRLGALGGCLEVWSAPGQGTRITATLPAEPPADEA